MKMTRLEWRYLQRIALDHPFFDTHELPLTEKEAKAIVEANIKMTGKEFVDSIYVKLGMTRPQEEKKHFTWLHNIGELFTVPPIRKIAIAVLVVVLMTVFFAATPTGRAIAESVIQYIATLLEDGSLVVNQGDRDTTLIATEDIAVSDNNNWQDDNNSIVYLDSFDTFAMETGRNPIVLSLPLSELYYDYDGFIDYLKLQATYETQRGKIVTCQIWNVFDMASTTSSEYMVYESDSSIYYSIEDDGDIIVMKVFEDSVCMITAEGNYTLSDCINLLVGE